MGNKRSASSSRWLKEHFKDQYVQKAQKTGARSRAVFKLEELNQKDRLLKKGMNVLDLGAAPGGWSQYCAGMLDGSGRVVATDILPMDPLAGVEFVQGDFTEQVVLDQLLSTLNGDAVDLVLSDMAPNMTGMRAVDQARAMYLSELAWDLASKVLKPGGSFLIKVFQGEGFDELLAQLRGNFEVVKSRKPDASRARSREVYLLGQRLKKC